MHCLFPLAAIAATLLAPAGARTQDLDSVRAAAVRAAAVDTGAPAPLPRGAQVVRVGDKEFIYTRPGRFEIVGNLPSDFNRFARSAFRSDRGPAWIGIAASTGVLLAVDQQLVDDAQRFGRTIHLSQDHKMVDLFKVPIPFDHGKQFPVRGPASFSSFIYFLGDGWSSVLTAVGLATAGAFTHDSRALRTASEVMEAFLATGITAQVLKHSFGRETPSEQAANNSHSGGRWRPFPSWGAYSADVPGYDAFPSGHLATVMSTVTVVALNYPEKRWIRPLCYTTMGVLAFQMMNNGVHWASDYPLAIAFGDLFAHLVVERGRAVRKVADATSGEQSHALRLTAPDLIPLVGAGRAGMALRFDF